MKLQKQGCICIEKLEGRERILLPEPFAPFLPASVPSSQQLFKRRGSLELHYFKGQGLPYSGLTASLCFFQFENKQFGTPLEF